MVIVFGPDGSVLWRRLFDREGMDDVRAVAVGRHGSVYVAGRTGGSPLVRKYGPEGVLKWSRVTNDGPLASGRADAIAVARGGPYVAYSVGHRMWLRRFTPGGRLLWSHEVQDMRPSVPIWVTRYSPAVRALAADSTGAYLVGGRQDGDGGSNMMLAKFDRSGSLRWIVERDAGQTTVSATALSVWKSRLAVSAELARRGSARPPSAWWAVYSLP